MDIKKQKFFYLAPSDIQVPRVDRQCIVYFCEALQKKGVNITLISLGIKLLDTEKKTDDPLDVYRISNRFPTEIINTNISQKNLDKSNCFFDLYRFWVYFKKISRILEINKNEILIFYCKNYSFTYIIRLLNYAHNSKSFIFFEAHNSYKSIYKTFALKISNGIISNSFNLMNDLKKIGKIDVNKIIGIHQGVSLEFFDKNRITKDTAREIVNLPKEKKIILYAGKIYWRYKEIDYIIKAANLNKNLLFVLVGGRKDHNERWIEHLKNNSIENVIFVGFILPANIHNYLFAADILLLYYPEGIDINKYRSPGKIFEYMAAGRPIICADYPVLHEIVSENEVKFVKPDSPSLLSDAIKELINDETSKNNYSKNVLLKIKEFTWDKRASEISDFINKIINEN